MKQLKLNNFLATLLTMAALFAGQTAWAQTRELTLSEDNDFPAGTAGHYYVNMLTYFSQQLTLTEADLMACGYTFKVYDDGGKDSEYTITVNPENVEMSYLHLIDNLTGADVDLLPLCKGGQGDSNTPVGSPFVKGAGGLNNPASYTFTASITDYESRFKLVFVANENDNENENTPFAFINNGNIIVNGEGTLQIVDVLGRVLFSQENATVNYQLSIVNYASGVYVLRLINGDDVKTQKIVVR